MFVSRLASLGVALALLAAFALGAARPSVGATPETRYVVQPGDTLWGIAAARYGGDPREGVWKLQEANMMSGSTLVPGQVILVPG
ncbi:MAG TPA: LysM peptidoglycan-binding domain-containing protein [Gaiellaceae bacterium]|jgi:nucleoid-associated protein YgaU|nr:LysM peptidoglycan-binding domain-containing protein [Gaiellaceae bacterium]